VSFDHLVRSRQLVDIGFSLKQRAQLTFSSWNKVRAFGKLNATNLAQVHHSFVRARREPLERSVVPCSSVDGFSSKPRAQLTFSSWNKVKAFGELDEKSLAIVTVLSFALVVSH